MNRARVLRNTALTAMLGVGAFVAVSAALNLTNNPEPAALAWTGSASHWPRASELTILTLNVQDLPVVASHRPERMAAVGRLINRLAPDLVGLQEAFVDADRAVLLQALGNKPMFAKYFESGFAGSGLLTLSRYPIRETAFHRFVSDGKWYKFHHGDWWAGKGIGLVRVEIRPGVLIDFYNTHLQAEYDASGEYVGVRTAQMLAMASFVEANGNHAIPALLVGDLNSRLGDAAYETGVAAGQFVDLTRVDSGIDHIMGRSGPCFEFEVVDTRAIDERVVIADGSQPLSDHTGYLSSVMIRNTAC